MPAPDGPQFITVFHASYHEKPPHLKNLIRTSRNEDQTNAHPDVLHVGSQEVVDGSFKNRQYIHKYDVPVDSTYGITFGDEERFLKDSYAQSRVDAALDGTGTQEGLFERTPADPAFALKTKMAVPYRNSVEGAGSISYMVPKELINNGTVLYRGVTSRPPD
jgi:hypothetical protein